MKIVSKMVLAHRELEREEEELKEENEHCLMTIDALRQTIEQLELQFQERELIELRNGKKRNLDAELEDALDSSPLWDWTHQEEEEEYDVLNYSDESELKERESLQEGDDEKKGEVEGEEERAGEYLESGAEQKSPKGEQESKEGDQEIERVSEEKIEGGNDEGGSQRASFKSPLPADSANPNCDSRQHVNRLNSAPHFRRKRSKSTSVTPGLPSKSSMPSTSAISITTTPTRPPVLLRKPHEMSKGSLPKSPRGSPRIPKLRSLSPRVLSPRQIPQFSLQRSPHLSPRKSPCLSPRKSPCLNLRRSPCPQNIPRSSPFPTSQYSVTSFFSSSSSSSSTSSSSTTCSPRRRRRRANSATAAEMSAIRRRWTPPKVVMERYLKQLELQQQLGRQVSEQRVSRRAPLSAERKKRRKSMVDIGGGGEKKKRKGELKRNLSSSLLKVEEKIEKKEKEIEKEREKEKDSARSSEK